MTKFISLLLLLPLHSAAFVISPNRILSFCRTSDDVDSSLYSSFDDAIVEDQDDEEPVETPGPPLPGIEKAWRHAKKPLLRVGGKGFTKTHGNSLRQLLEDHTVVKVKLNTKKYGTLKEVFPILAKLAEEAGVPEGVEYIQSREIENTVMFGMPGTLARIAAGDFPPPPPPKWKTPAELAAEKEEE